MEGTRRRRPTDEDETRKMELQEKKSALKDTLMMLVGADVRLRGSRRISFCLFYSICIPRTLACKLWPGLETPCF